MRRRLLIGFVLIAAASVADAHDALDAVRFEQRLNAAVPLDVLVRDASGSPVRLGRYFHRRPVLLMLVYYHCPNLCGTLLTSLGIAAARSGLAAGGDYELVVLSIDPRETPAQAAKARLTLVHEVAGRGGMTNAHLLTADAEAVSTVARAVGFHYYYDATADQYAHPAGAAALTPDGRVARYLYGAPFAPRDLRFALIEAGAYRIGGPLDRIWLRCFHYDPVTGRYSVAVLEALRALSALTLAVMGLAFAWVYSRRRSSHD